MAPATNTPAQEIQTGMDIVPNWTGSASASLAAWASATRAKMAAATLLKDGPGIFNSPILAGPDTVGQEARNLIGNDSAPQLGRHYNRSHIITA